MKKEKFLKLVNKLLKKYKLKGTKITFFGNFMLYKCCKNDIMTNATAVCSIYDIVNHDENICTPTNILFKSKVVLIKLKDEIKFNRVYIKYATDDMIKNTILHEIAHLLCREKGHTKNWSKYCIELGIIPEPITNINDYKIKLPKYMIFNIPIYI